MLSEKMKRVTALVAGALAGLAVAGAMFAAAEWSAEDPEAVVEDTFLSDPVLTWGLEGDTGGPR